MIAFGGPWLLAVVFLAAETRAPSAETIAAASLPTRPDAAAAANAHPPVPLLDLDGRSVLTSGQPISTMKTCAGCHDTNYIAAHSYHVSLGRDEAGPLGRTASGRPWDWSPGAFGRWNPLTYRRLSPPKAQQLDLGTAEWIQRFGWRHVGGGPAWFGHGDQPLAARRDEVPTPARFHPDRHVLDPVTGGTRNWDWNRSGGVEMNCFLCHAAQPDNQARRQALERGLFHWANTATLAGTGIVEPRADGWSYRAASFLSDGTVDAARLGLREPSSRHCGLCHGAAESSPQPLRLDLSLAAWSTATKGQVFSPQRISESAMNLANKEQLARPWDVHAERLLECSSCHFSINNPAFYEPTPRTRPAHLRFEPRRLAIHEFLSRPSHQFAKGHTSQGTLARHLDGTMRRCGDCHDATVGHDWLPYRDAHFQRLSCEACHIPRAYAPAIRQIDWTLVSAQGEPRVEWRGLRGEPDDATVAIDGFRPALLPACDIEGRARLVPHNLITAWYWVGGDAVPVRSRDLQAAMLAGSDYHPAVREKLDSNHDGQVTTDERRLDTPEKVEAVRQRLEAVGVERPQIAAEIQPYSLHHGVGPKRTATRDCRVCHSARSILREPFALASYCPGDVLPTPVRDNDARMIGAFADGESTRLDTSSSGSRRGQLTYWPDTKAANMYVFGQDRWRWVDSLGIVFLLGVTLAVSGHAAMRIYAWLRRRNRG